VKKNQIEPVAVLLVLLAAPLWLPAVPASLSESPRLLLSDFLRPAFRASQVFQSSFRDLASGFLQAPALVQENRALKQQVQTLLAHEATHQALFMENARLRALVDLKDRVPWDVITAEVIGREIGLWSRSLLLDRGHEDGVRIGQAVITSVGLVGRVQQVGRKTSRILLVTDPHFRVAATLSRIRMTGRAP